MTEREELTFDVVIVGAGPAGLAAAIRLRQLATAAERPLSICVLEKSSAVGAHILSGGVLDPVALAELFPDWKNRGAPIETPVQSERLLMLSAGGSKSLPMPPSFRNHGNYIISLGNLCRWLGEQADAMDIQIFPGFPASELIMGSNDNVTGVTTKDMGVGRDGKPGPDFVPGVRLRARHTMIAEGARGFLAEQVISHYNLRSRSDPQIFGLGLKELWDIPSGVHRQGTVVHTLGWPLPSDTYGGGFLYHMEDGQVSVGLIVGLDYRNPYLDPFQAFQRLKSHPSIRPLLEGGRRVAYGAKALTEGGYQSIPQLVFPGGSLIGCSAGFMNVARLKGIHTAMKSGMTAAEAVFESLSAEKDEKRDAETYPRRLKASWLWNELYKARNVRPAFHGGLLTGLARAAVDTYIFGGRAPWTGHHRPDHQQLRPAKQYRPTSYPAPDGRVTFDRPSSLDLSGTDHEENQPNHLHLKDPTLAIAINHQRFAGPEQWYCPAGVYEFLTDQETVRLQINAPNCLHCKTCDIKDPSQNIRWTPPEGGGGPSYPNM